MDNDGNTNVTSRRWRHDGCYFRATLGGWEFKRDPSSYDGTPVYVCPDCKALVPREALRPADERAWMEGT